MEAEFKTALDEWIQHCENPRVQVSSKIQDYINCDGYRKILSLGKSALPSIREAYNLDSSDNIALDAVKVLGLVGLVKKIVGEDFSIPEQLQGRMYELAEYTKSWLDQNMTKY